MEFLITNAFLVGYSTNNFLSSVFIDKHTTQQITLKNMAKTSDSQYIYR